jgi:hypothetical protein
MRLTAAFFANRAAVEDGMLSVGGGFWSSTTVAPRSAGFMSNTVVVCEVDPEDVGRQFSLHIDAQGPTGQRWTPARSRDFTVGSLMMFMILAEIVLPIEPSGGRHVYTFRLDGQHERVDLPLDVRVGRR